MFSFSKLHLRSYWAGLILEHSSSQSPYREFYQFPEQLCLFIKLVRFEDTFFRKELPILRTEDSNVI